MAEALFQEGRRLTSEGRYAEACPKFAESHRLEPAIGTLLNLAACHAAEGKTASAWSELTSALAQGQRANRTDVTDFAQAKWVELLPQLSKLTIEVSPDVEVEGLEVRLDGQVLQKPAWGVAAPIDPGKHLLGASAPGYAEWTSEVVLGAAEAKTQRVPPLAKLPQAPAEPAPTSAPALRAASPAAPESLAQRERAPAWPAQKTWAIGLGGAGVFGVAASVALGFSAKGTFNDANPHCDALGCDDEGLKLRHDAVVRGRVATAVFGVGMVALAGGAVLWLTAPSARSRTALSIGVTPRALVARVAWR